MFTGFTDETIQFFLDLRFHNYTEFFHEQHDRYIETVQRPFYELINDLAPVALRIDSSMEVRPHKCLSRIHRDTRFSKDKSPYRDHLWFLFRQSGIPREKSLFLFGEFGPDRLDWGMGIWGENRELLDQFRRRIASNPEGVLAMIDDMNLPEHGLGLGGTAFKRMEIPHQVPQRLERWYRAKDFYIGKVMPEYSWAFSDRLFKEMKKDFLALLPLYQLLQGISENLM